MTNSFKDLNGVKRTVNGKVHSSHCGQFNDNGMNDGGRTRVPANHWVLPTAASFGWIVEAAAANPLR